MEGYGESAELAAELVMEETQVDAGAHRMPRWHKQVAFTTLVLALMTAVGALLAGITAHEAVLERTHEAIEVSIIEGDRVTVEVLKAKHEILISMGESPDPAEVAEIEAYEEQIAELMGEANLEEGAVAEASSTHLILAIAVTILAVGTTLSGMAIIVDQKLLWFASITFGVVGTIGVFWGIATLVT